MFNFSRQTQIELNKDRTLEAHPEDLRHQLSASSPWDFDLLSSNSLTLVGLQQLFDVAFRSSKFRRCSLLFFFFSFLQLLSHVASPPCSGTAAPTLLKSLSYQPQKSSSGNSTLFAEHPPPTHHISTFFSNFLLP